MSLTLSSEGVLASSSGTEEIDKSELQSQRRIR